LLRHFACVVVNCSLLQQADDVEGEFFRTITLQSGRYNMSFEEAVTAAPDWTHGQTHTHQGHFVGTADGLSLGSSFGHADGGDSTSAMLEQALAQCRELPASPAASVSALAPLDGRDPLKSWPVLPDDDWLVLQLTCRDLSRPRRLRSLKQDDTPDAFNNDFVWLSPSEVAALVPDPTAPAGTDTIVPQWLAKKLARFHLIDCVRGEGVTWPESAVHTAELTVCIDDPSESPTADSGETSVTFRGEFALCEQPDGMAAAEWQLDSNETFATSADTSKRSRPAWRGLVCSMLGQATFAQPQHGNAKFSTFDAVITGVRWGRQHLEGRVGDEAPAGICFGLTLSQDRTTPPRGAPAAYLEASPASASTAQTAKL
jgi:hypothetical protein